MMIKLRESESGQMLSVISKERGVATSQIIHVGIAECFTIAVVNSKQRYLSCGR